MMGSHVLQDRFHLVDKGRHLSSFLGAALLHQITLFISMLLSLLLSSVMQWITMFLLFSRKSLLWIRHLRLKNISQMFAS